MAELASDFPAATEDAWRALVAKTLGDAPFESLQKTTVEGLPIAPLYPSAAAAAFPTRPFDAERAWDLRTLTAHPDPARANAELLADLEGGAASAVVKIDPTGQAGVTVGSADGLARVLQGVILELAPVALDAGFLGPKAADWLGTVAKASPGAKLNFHLGSAPGGYELIVAGHTLDGRLGTVRTHLPVAPAAQDAPASPK